MLTMVFAGGGAGEEGAPSLQLPDVFCALGCLIAEGRLPAGESGAAGRGYTEGPHVELPGRVSRHKCSEQDYLVSNRYLLLLSKYSNKIYKVCVWHTCVRDSGITAVVECLSEVRTASPAAGPALLRFLCTATPAVLTVHLYSGGPQQPSCHRLQCIPLFHPLEV